MKHRLHRLLLLPALLVLGAISAPSLAGIEPPPPDDAGSFVGTWYYVDPGYRIAIFVSDDAPGPLKLRYHVRDSRGNEYETDALGKAKYVDQDELVRVTFTGKLEGANKITGRHERVVQAKDGSKIQESGSFELYRAESSRKVVLRYSEWRSQRIGKTGRVLSTNVESDVVRLFRRASTMVVDFSEIRF